MDKARYMTKENLLGIMQNGKVIISTLPTFE